MPVYQFAPKSWKPDLSLANTVAAEQLAEAVQENRERIVDFLSADPDNNGTAIESEQQQAWIENKWVISCLRFMY